jgi:molybdopterin synthase catalytic subunit
MIRVAVSDAPIALAEALEAIERVAGAGAVASFTGLVRADDGVTALTLEHYPGMTERALEAIARAAYERWALKTVTIRHRVGPMQPGERIVFVGVAAEHRQAALDACAYCIDRLKTDAPFWKREAVAGAERWVEARKDDQARADRWE